MCNVGVIVLMFILKISVISTYKVLKMPLVNSSKVLVAQSCPTLCEPMDCSPPGSSIHGDSSGKNTGVGCHALHQGTFPSIIPGIEPRSPALQAESGGRAGLLQQVLPQGLLPLS